MRPPPDLDDQAGGDPLSITVTKSEVKTTDAILGTLLVEVKALEKLLEGGTGEGVFRGPNPPPNPTDGMLWFNTVENRLYEFVVP